MFCRVTQELSNDIKIITLWQSLDFLWFWKQQFWFLKVPEKWFEVQVSSNTIWKVCELCKKKKLLKTKQF